MDLADWAAVGHQDGWLKLYRVLGGDWVETHPGFIVGVLGMPAGSFNGVTVYSGFDETELTDALTRVADSGLPFNLQARPAVADAAGALASRFGLTPEAGMPLMGLTDRPAEPAIDGLTLRPLGPSDAAVHAALTAEAFGATVDLMLELTPPETMRGHGAHFHGGEVGGEIVATAMADVNHTTAWLFLVATAEAHRRRGLAAAVTAAAVRAAFDDGAEMAFLLSTPMATRVYEGIGFRQLEWWSGWTHRGKAA